jgi:hypothetical protein
MKKVKREKTTWEKLNPRQQEAINKSQTGDYELLIKVCLECHKAENKIIAAMELGAKRWGEQSITHYQEIRFYLESQFANDTIWQAYQHLVENQTNG